MRRAKRVQSEGSDFVGRGRSWARQGPRYHRRPDGVEMIVHDEGLHEGVPWFAEEIGVGVARCPESRSADSQPGWWKLPPGPVVEYDEFGEDQFGENRFGLRDEFRHWLLLQQDVWETLAEMRERADALVWCFDVPQAERLLAAGADAERIAVCAVNLW